MLAPVEQWRRLILPAAILAVTLVGAACAVRLPTTLGSGQAPFNGGVLDPPLQLPALTLQRTDGSRFTTAETRGHLSIFFFGYTSCPDVCPMTLAQVAQARRQLGVRAGQVDTCFVTVDPARDTPERLAAYVAGFDPGVIALTGTPLELGDARSVFGAAAEKRSGPEGTAGYFMDHGAALYLVDSESRIRLVYSPEVTPAHLAADIERLLAQ